MDEELNHELRFHLERQEAKYRESGLSSREAARRARLDFGGPAQIEDECRDARGTRWLDDAVHDLRLGLRTASQNIVFLSAVVVTIAVGIGASTAIFSVANAVLLRPLPYKQADRLALVFWENRRAGVRSLLYSNADFLDVRSGSTSIFEDLAGVACFRAFVPRADGSAEQLSKAIVSTNFFRLMGARIAFGRDFDDTDAAPQPLQPNVLIPAGTTAILSYEYWQRRYAGSTAALGQELPGGSGLRGPRIVGVLAPGFTLFFPPAARMDALPDFWVANNIGYDTAHRNLLMAGAVGRLRPGITFRRAGEQLNALSPELRKNSFDPEARLHLQSMRQYLVEDVRPAILALMGAVLFLLLIACANVANLLLVRASWREREFAVRAALGGSRWRLVRQMLAESLILSGMGTLLGILVASSGIRGITRVAPANLPRIESVSIDWTVLAFAAAAGLCATVLFGLVPALRAASPNIIEGLRTGGRTPASQPGRLLRNTIVMAEVALSFVLLAGSGLMFRSFVELRRVDPGYDPHGLLTFFATRDWPLPRQEGRLELLRAMQARLRAIPGVEDATAALILPLAGGGRPGPSTGIESAEYQQVLPGYFETLRTRVLAGRTFTEADNAPGRNLAVVDDLYAAKAFPNDTAVGKRIPLPDPAAPPAEVIGVVAHQRLLSLTGPGRQTMFFCDGFQGIGVSRSWIVRTAGDPAKYAAAVRAAIAGIDRQVVISKMQPMDALVEHDRAGTRLALLLLGAFAAVAALLATVGLYGVLATVVRQRTAEIGLRMAVGATPSEVFRLVARYGLTLCASGVAAGWLVALALTRVMESMLVGVRPIDPLAFTAATIFFLLIAAAACSQPARRAARLDPASVLRES
jgi:putative ABC transport system permease protein